VSIDTFNPTVTVNIVDASLSDSDNQSEVTFEFTEDVSGFTTDDVTASGGTISGFSILDSNSYFATFTADDNLDATGSVSVGTGYTDAAGNAGSPGADTVVIRTDLIETDSGDAPDGGSGTGSGNYRTTQADGGPSHAIVPGLFLGASVDGDDGLLQNTQASADDVDSALPDDEDGVLSPLDLRGTEGAAPTVTLLVTNTTGSAATLSGWIDYNQDGVFDNATERAQVAVPDATTDERITLTFPAIPSDSAGETYARFRLSTDASGQNSTGAASDGEVEDYPFSISAPTQGMVASSLIIASETNGGPSLADNDYFGSSVASIGDLDGDGVADLAVGAYSDDAGGLNSGAVYVLLLNRDGSVKNRTKITSGANGGPTLSLGDSFGDSVTSLGDLDGDGVVDLAIGATYDRTGGIFGGAVHVLFLNADGSVKSSTKIAHETNGGPSLGDRDFFGRAVTSVGDLDGDGVADLAVGATGDDTGGRARGAVHVLLLNADGSVKESSKIASGLSNGPVLSNDDAFGRSLASVGDLDGDGVSDLAVGAHGDDPDGSPYGILGAVHVLFMNSDGSVKTSTKIANGTNGGPALGEHDLFGSSVASVGDLDGDRVPDLVVGAFDDTGGTDRGAVHVLLLNVDGSVKSALKIASGTNGGPPLADYDHFGSSVSSAGDLNGDGVPDLAVGAFGDATGGGGYSAQGAVHVLFLTPPAEPQPAAVTLPAGDSYEVLRDAADLVVRVAGGSELLREAAEGISRLTVTGSADADVVTVLNNGTSVSTPITFSGGNGNDQFDGTLAVGSLLLNGNGGNDVLIGGSANDSLNGGSGADELVGNGGDDRLRGQGSTGDTLNAGDGNDTLDGGNGNDVIHEMVLGDLTLTNSSMTGRGNDVIISVERARITGGGAAQTIDASMFLSIGTSTTLLGGGGNDTLLGTAGADVLLGAGGSDLIDGGSGNDRVFGGSGADTLIGGAGNDLLKGLGGSGDQLSGGDGNDTINGGRGVDRLFESGDVDFTLTNTSLTGLGNDLVQAMEIAQLTGGASANVIDVSTFTGFRGFTQLRGNGGDDSIIGSSMTDIILGGDGNDTLLGKEGNDTLRGEDGNDGLSGFDGDDVLDAGRGFDRGFGGLGNDTLTGGAARDTLVGGDGDDNISGNDGNDTLVGGTGNNDASMGDVVTDGMANIDEAFTLDPLPGWVDQV
jgi:hypothetical protein